MAQAQTYGELLASGWTPSGVKEEMRRNLIRMLRDGTNPFPGILGYDETVIPQIRNAVLAKHDILLLGLRGQAKTRLARLMVNLLDAEIPALRGCPLRSCPSAPLTRSAKRLLEEKGKDAEIEWIPRSARYQEKLATPDVSIADLIGDVDPIKAMSRKLDLSDEEAIHFGIIPRANRGIFVINELPDLQARIQVGLLNIMEEKDIQIRGFPVRMPLDLAIVYTANPEDYTNRGNIITPLKDRIDAQIMTHYPESAETGMAITLQEAWTGRDGAPPVELPDLLRRLIEQVAVEARRSDYVDRNSGVSARMSISLYETVHSVAEARAVLLGEPAGVGRIADLLGATPAICGKVELIYKGEQEGIANVAAHLAGRAVKTLFNSRVVPNWRPDREPKHDFHEFKPVVEWFEEGNRLEFDDSTSSRDFAAGLRAVRGLESCAKRWFKPASERELVLAMEFILDGLHQNFLLTKRGGGRRVAYSDSISSMVGN